MMTAQNWHVKILKRAKVELQRQPVDDPYAGVCLAIEMAKYHLFRHNPCNMDGTIEEARFQVKCELLRRLGNHAFLQDWLYHQHGIYWRGDLPKLRVTRLAWIDDMIKWWEQHGEKA
jgi:hypothetical protein